jgi:hypothetical protein
MRCDVMVPTAGFVLLSTTQTLAEHLDLVGIERPPDDETDKPRFLCCIWDWPSLSFASGIDCPLAQPRSNHFIFRNSRDVSSGYHCIFLLRLPGCDPNFSMSLSLLLSAIMRLPFFLVRLRLLLLLRHDVLEHGPQSFDLTEFVADLSFPNALVGISCISFQSLLVGVVRPPREEQSRGRQRDEHTAITLSKLLFRVFMF